MSAHDSDNTKKRARDDNLEEKPHYVGHRERLRRRLLEQGGETLADYEVLEVLLFAGNPRGDVKPLAKELLRRFGTLSAILGTAPTDLKGSRAWGTAPSPRWWPRTRPGAGRRASRRWSGR